ncbi:hypothetical protein DFP72DRAFT_1065136 [Ephemerocybe angulata]|uniref:Secreted protein n=1 Tax=Ephemerocybe angulata TaxID=980116 RepID=A0A8H6MBA5_9AGAR|nr:hypothetical protein DFP72DRAFT_1065136 [Tulosesus angulatus]
MQFLSFRNAFLALATVCLINFTFALPLLRNKNNDLVGRDYGSDALTTLVGRDNDFHSQSLSQRDLWRGTDSRVYTRSPNGLQSLEEALLETRKNHPIRVTAKAKQDIKNMLPPNHTRQDYKNAKQWHRDQVQPHMNAHGATSATIKRGAHSGGFNRHAPPHITAKLKGPNGVIHTQYTNSKGQRRTADQHHVPVHGAPHGATIPHTGPH